MKKIFAISAALAVLAAAGPALAIPPTQSAHLAINGTARNLTLPATANNSPVISLGGAIDPASGQFVEGYAFIHYKKGFDHKPRHNGTRGGGGGDTTSVCYAFLAKNTRWNSAEDYSFDPTNSRGLDGATLSSLLANGVEAWDSETSLDVFGTEVAGVVDGADTVNPDGKNEVLFANVDSSGAIAVTIVWGVFRGPPSQRGLVEWDMVFDDVDFDWSAEAAGVADKMDFLNIAVHELGHAAGMGHPSDSCSEETMFRFAGFNETKKRDLNAGDVDGINALYQ